MDEKEYEHELFGNVIFSYTDAEALQDGVLFGVEEYSRHKVNRVTANVYTWLGGFINEEGFPQQYRELEDVAIEALHESKDKDLVEFQYKGKRFWFMDNEVGGKTIMFPEDY